MELDRIYEREKRTEEMKEKRKRLQERWEQKIDVVR